MTKACGWGECPIFVSPASLVYAGGVLILVAALPRWGGETGFWINGLYDALCVLLLFPLLVWLAAGEVSVTSGMQRLCRQLGELSYPLYQVHFPFLYVYYAWVKNGSLSFLDSLPGAVALVVGSILLATAALYLYDRPVRRWLSGSGRQA